MNPSIVYLSLSALISSCGTTLFVSALALSFFNVDSSAVKASGVYIAQFLPVVFLLPLAVRICDGNGVREGMAMVDIFSAIITVLMGVCVELDWLVAVYLILAIRGFLELVAKTFRSVGVKNLTDPVNLEVANNLVMGGNFLGQALGALLGFFLVSKVSLLLIAIIDGFTYVASAICCLKIVSIDVDKNLRPPVFLSSTWIGFTELKKNEILRFYFICFSLVVVLFQSYNQVARTWIPLAWLDMGLGKGIIGEIIGCLGIVIGLLTVGYIMSSAVKAKLGAVIAIVLSALLLSAPFVSRDPVVSLALYFLYMVLFEVGLMISMNGVLAVCPKERVAAVMGIFYCFSFGGLTFASLSLAFAADAFGLPAVSLALSGIAILLVCFIYCFHVCNLGRNLTSSSQSSSDKSSLS